ncbi:MAG: hypothetical protein ACR2KU_11860 [Gammaproteobacteria bacterium]
MRGNLAENQADPDEENHQCCYWHSLHLKFSQLVNEDESDAVNPDHAGGDDDDGHKRHNRLEVARDIIVLRQPAKERDPAPT